MTNLFRTPRRLCYTIGALIAGFALTMTLAPASQASSSKPTAPSSIVLPMPLGPRIHPTAAQIRQGKIARRVLNARSHNKGKIIDFRRAIKAAGKGNKIIAQDVVLGILRGGGKVTHLSRRERSQLIVRARKLGQRSVIRKLSGARSSLRAGCAGVNSIDHFWWGYRGRLDNCWTSFVKDALETVAFTGGLLAVRFSLDARSKSIMTVAIAFVGLGIFVIDRCNRQQRGVRIYHAITFGPADIWCLSQ